MAARRLLCCHRRHPEKARFHRKEPQTRECRWGGRGGGVGQRICENLLCAFCFSFLGEVLPEIPMAFLALALTTFSAEIEEVDGFGVGRKALSKTGRPLEAALPPVDISIVEAPFFLGDFPYYLL